MDTEDTNDSPEQRSSDEFNDHFKVDPAVIAGKYPNSTPSVFASALANALPTALPPNIRISSIAGHGTSLWTRTARIDGELEDGTPKTYFLKLATGIEGNEMMHGEYESEKALHAMKPDFVPYPIASGTYISDPNTHFFLCDFQDMVDSLPDVDEFCNELAQLHSTSMLHSLDGRFGFHTTTCNGKLAQDNVWSASWEEFYIRGLKHMFEIEKQVQGPCDELDELLPHLYEKVVPRLLRPLETGGRSIQPCLVHGDLHDGNIAVDVKTGKPLIYDGSVFWAHNEYEMGTWRCPRYPIGPEFFESYQQHIPPSEPTEDWDDRNALYCLRADIHESALYPTTAKFRRVVIEEVRELVEKFPNGYEGSEPQKPATLPASVVETDAEDTESTTCQPEFDTLDTLKINDLQLDKETSIGDIESAPLLLDAVDGLVVGQQHVHQITKSNVSIGGKEDFNRDIRIVNADFEYVLAAALLDTACQSGNWISLRLVERLGKQNAILQKYEPPSVQDANGQEMPACGVVTLQWKWSNHGTRVYDGEFFVMPGSQHLDVVFGVEYIVREGLIYFNGGSIAHLTAHKKLKPEEKAAMNLAAEKQRQENEAAEARRRADSERRSKEVTKQGTEKVDPQASSS